MQPKTSRHEFGAGVVPKEKNNETHKQIYERAIHQAVPFKRAAKVCLRAADRGVGYDPPVAAHGQLAIIRIGAERIVRQANAEWRRRNASALRPTSEWNGGVVAARRSQRIGNGPRSGGL
jgi:hypothetical protein